jgi:hypothetical protein
MAGTDLDLDSDLEIDRPRTPGEDQQSIHQQSRQVKRGDMYWPIWFRDRDRSRPAGVP